MPDPKDKDDEGVLDSIKDFLNRPLWGTDREEDETERSPADTTTKPAEAAPKSKSPAAPPAAAKPAAPPVGPPAPSAKPVAPPAAPPAVPPVASAPATPATPPIASAPQAVPPVAPASPAPPAGGDSDERIRELERRLAEMEQSAREAAREKASSQRTYTVVGGDSLSKIAQHFYGDMMQWRRIYDANRDQISNPDLIHKGQVLVIP